MEMVHIGSWFDDKPQYTLCVGDDALSIQQGYGLDEYSCFMCLVNNGSIEEIWGTSHAVPWTWAAYNLLYMEPLGLVTEQNTPTIANMEDERL
jgi:hypothetical protein